MEFDIKAIRKDFPALNQNVYNKPLVYLDNAATTQKPQCVIDAITNYYSNIYENDPLYIKITALQVSGYINDIKDINNDSITCTGYTKVVKNNNRITYNSYIKCDDSYTTKGYVSRFDSQGL